VLETRVAWVETYDGVPNDGKKAWERRYMRIPDMEARLQQRERSE
jgi:hypothetical protein